MKNFYITVTIEEKQKYYSYVIKVNSGDNLLSKLKIKNIAAADVHETKKRATEVASERNSFYKINNSYLFDETF